MELLSNSECVYHKPLNICLDDYNGNLAKVEEKTLINKIINTLDVDVTKVIKHENNYDLHTKTEKAVKNFNLSNINHAFGKTYSVKVTKDEKQKILTISAFEM